MSHELTVMRTFNAPIEKVWKAWSDPKIFAKWYGPQSFTTPVCKIDFKVGGIHLWAMQSPDGNKYYSTGEYKEIIPMNKIVYTDTMCDENGNPQPGETLVTIIFEDLGDKTQMTLKQAGMPDDMAVGGATQGWNQSFDKLINSID